MHYAYCYYCERYLTALGQQTKCDCCQSEIASLSSCGRLHYETAQRLTAQVRYRKAQESSTI